jgi:hypothetical protein
MNKAISARSTAHALRSVTERPAWLMTLFEITLRRRLLSCCMTTLEYQSPQPRRNLRLTNPLIIFATAAIVHFGLSLTFALPWWNDMANSGFDPWVSPGRQMFVVIHEFPMLRIYDRLGFDTGVDWRFVVFTAAPNAAIFGIVILGLFGFVSRIRRLLVGDRPN